MAFVLAGALAFSTSFGSIDRVDGVVLPVAGQDCLVRFTDPEGQAHIWDNQGGRGGCDWSVGAHHTLYLPHGDPSQVTDESPAATRVVGVVLLIAGLILGAYSVASLRDRRWRWSEPDTLAVDEPA